MTRRALQLKAGEECEQWAALGSVGKYPEWIDDAWHDVTDALMALYHYVLAYAPQEEE